MDKLTNSRFIKSIDLKSFCNKFKVDIIDLAKLGFFTYDDYLELSKSKPLISYAIKYAFNPPRTIKSIQHLLRQFFYRLSEIIKSKLIPINNLYPINDYIYKCSIITSFKPRKFLEIGTHLGWAVASVKFANPNCLCFTMNPKNNNKANNPIDNKMIGATYRNKKLKVKQIYADSARFNFKKLNKVDISYIDGNHKYKWVLSDLTNCDKITKKMVMLDDYIPSEKCINGYIKMYGDWHREVVTAVEDFMKKNHKRFRYAYWIKKTPICILIKK